METVRMTATEREALIRVNLGLTFLLDDVKPLENRTRMIKRGGWLLATARGCLQKYIHEALKTVSLDQLKTLNRTIRETTYSVGVRCPATQNRDIEKIRDFGIVVSYESMHVLLDACKEKCHLCGYDTEGQRRCPLRKALDSIPNDQIREGQDECPYYQII